MFLIETEKGKKYCSLCNTNGKKWLFDYEAINIGLCLYQPSSKKGRLIKKFIQNSWGGLFFRFFSKSHTYLIDENFQKIVNELFGCSDVQYSFFEGTPGIHCKIVGQVSSGHDILGYFKLTNSKSIYSLFEKEYDLVTYLHSVGMNNVPNPICVKKIEDEYVYFQTTKKSIDSIVPNDYNTLINNFLCELYDRTFENIKYEHSAIYRNIHDLEFGKRRCVFKEKYMYYLSLFDEQLSNKTVEMCIAHRDFTPWNMFIENENLFVFDWEYASKEYLPMMDMFHFEIQRKIMDEGLGIQELIKYIDTNWGGYMSCVSRVTLLETHWIFVAYLLDFIALYVSRANNLSDEEFKSVELRFNLLQHIEKKYM